MSVTIKRRTARLLFDVAYRLWEDPGKLVNRILWEELQRLKAEAPKRGRRSTPTSTDGEPRASRHAVEGDEHPTLTANYKEDSHE